MNANPIWLATRELLAVHADGRRVSITLRIGLPYEFSAEEWACPVALDGLHDRLADIHGIDAWQALNLAQSLQAQLLGYFLQAGGSLFCHEPPEPIQLSELFPKVPAGL